MKLFEPVADQQQRDRFTSETKQPFSVIAPAGVGKTHSIIERVARMISAGVELIALVTYTKKAAEEMRQRLEMRLRREGKILPYEKIFIGTIHALCLELMQQNAQQWSLPQRMEVFSDVEDLYTRWLEAQPNPLKNLSMEEQERFLRYFDGILEKKNCHLLTQEGLFKKSKKVLSLPPALDFTALFQAEFKGPQKKTHERLKAWAQEYIALHEHPPFAMPELPAPPSDESPLIPLYHDIFGKFSAWKTSEGFVYVQILAKEFAEWRRKSGFYLYDDLIDLVLEKIETKKEASRYSIVLDEAQDTSPKQLDVLKKLAKEENGKLQMTIVGDPQQSIYSSRASLPHYINTHDDLIKNHGLQPLTFSVTFRCPRQVIDWVNATGSQLLRASATQAEFVPLQPKPGAAIGQINRMVLPKAMLEEKSTTEERDWANARFFAAEMKRKLSAPEMVHQSHNIAILAARRDALFKISEALTEVGLRAQLHAEGETATPAERLAQSVLHIFKYPFDSFEILGLLRELSSASDRTLAGAFQEHPAAFNILQPPPADLPKEIFEVLSKWNNAWLMASSMPLDRALLAFIKESDIESSIQALDLVYGKTLWPAWRAEVLRMVSLARQGATAVDVVRAMKDAASETKIEPGALQLMTLHKAKGLEWPVVILPFLHRPMSAPPLSYPMIDPTAKDSALTWKLSPHVLAPANQENTQRLLYVGLTRAKEQLILVDDAVFYKSHEGSLAEYLNITQGALYHSDFTKLSQAAAFDVKENENLETVSAVSMDFQNISSPLPPITPSSLAQEQEREERELTDEEISGLEYGEWWHNMWPKLAETARDQMIREFSRLNGKTDFSARAQKEFDHLQKTPLWPQLMDEKTQLLAETPFFVELDEGVMEGRVDMVLMQKTQALVIDWKTDLLSPEALLATYGPQMQAYKRSFEKLLQRPVEVQLYSTVHACLIS